MLSNPLDDNEQISDLAVSSSQDVIPEPPRAENFMQPCNLAGHEMNALFEESEPEHLIGLQTTLERLSASLTQPISEEERQVAMLSFVLAIMTVAIVYYIQLQWS